VDPTWRAFGAAICKFIREEPGRLFHWCTILNSLVNWNRSGFSLSQDEKKLKTETGEEFSLLVGFLLIYWQR